MEEYVFSLSINHAYPSSGSQLSNAQQMAQQWHSQGGKLSICVLLSPDPLASYFSADGFMVIWKTFENFCFIGPIKARHF